MIGMKLKERTARNTVARKGATRKVVKRTRSFNPRPFLIIGLLFILLPGAIYLSFMGAIGAYNILNVPIERVAVNGPMHYVKERAVQNIISESAGDGFLSADLVLIKSKLEKIPGVFSATVTRVWPAGLSVAIQEEIAVAVWNRELLVSDSGSVFSDTGVASHEGLPRLNGPEAKQKTVMDQYKTLSQLIRTEKLKIEQLNLSESGSWSAKLENNLQLKLGKEPIIDKMQRFIAFYESKLVAEKNLIESVDLRYTNGLAVKQKRAS